jgi:hypothetical protein
VAVNARGRGAQVTVNIKDVVAPAHSPVVPRRAIGRRAPAVPVLIDPKIRVSGTDSSLSD